MKHIIEITNELDITIQNGQIKITKNNEDKNIIPIDNVYAIILDNPYIRISNALLQQCNEYNITIISCNAKHIPTSNVIPFSANYTNGKQIRFQISMSKFLGDKIWKEITIQKITNQANNLKLLGIKCDGLYNMCNLVKPNDPDNIEARASKLYWSLLFTKQFIRDDDKNCINAFLNYGYAILRSVVTKQICASGLLPILGIHHHNIYDQSPLANDLMEPFRPLVDNIVYHMSLTTELELNKNTKKQLLSLLTTHIKINDQKCDFAYAIQLFIESYRTALELKDQTKILTPIIFIG